MNKKRKKQLLFLTGLLAFLVVIFVFLTVTQEEASEDEVETASYLALEIDPEVVNEIGIINKEESHRIPK